MAMSAWRSRLPRSRPCSGLTAMPMLASVRTCSPSARPSHRGRRSARRISACSAPACGSSTAYSSPPRRRGCLPRVAVRSAGRRRDGAVRRRRVPEGVVDVLEVIEIQQRSAPSRPVALCTLSRSVPRGLEAATIQQRGQIIGARLLGVLGGVTPFHEGHGEPTQGDRAGSPTAR